MSTDSTSAPAAPGERPGAAKDFDLWLKAGCRCAQEACFGGGEQKECCYFIARTRGPITFRRCGHCGGKTYHAGDGGCLICGSQTGASAS